MRPPAERGNKSGFWKNTDFVVQCLTGKVADAMDLEAHSLTPASIRLTASSVSSRECVQREEHSFAS